MCEINASRILNTTLLMILFFFTFSKYRSREILLHGEGTERVNNYMYCLVQELSMMILVITQTWTTWTKVHGYATMSHLRQSCRSYNNYFAHGICIEYLHTSQGESGSKILMPFVTCDLENKSGKRQNHACYLFL